MFFSIRPSHRFPVHCAVTCNVVTIRAKALSGIFHAFLLERNMIEQGASLSAVFVFDCLCWHDD